MIYIPSIDNSDTRSIKDLRSEQYRLQKQADKLLSQIDLKDIFSKYGKVSEIGGSYSYGLMVYPDIDIEIINNIVTKDNASKLLKDIASKSYVRKVSFVDNVNHVSTVKGRPKGYWFGIEIPFEKDKWGIDCWIQQPDWIDESIGNPNIIDSTYINRLKTLPQESKDIILLIKYELIIRKLYGSKFNSINVYDAVLKDNVKTIDQFLTLYERI